jgi:hypothetical protein
MRSQPEEIEYPDKPVLSWRAGLRPDGEAASEAVGCRPGIAERVPRRVCRRRVLSDRSRTAGPEERGRQQNSIPTTIVHDWSNAVTLSGIQFRSD